MSLECSLTQTLPDKPRWRQEPRRQNCDMVEFIAGDCINGWRRVRCNFLKKQSSKNIFKNFENFFKNSFEKIFRPKNRKYVWKFPLEIILKIENFENFDFLIFNMVFNGNFTKIFPIFFRSRYFRKCFWKKFHNFWNCFLMIIF